MTDPNSIVDPARSTPVLMLGRLAMLGVRRSILAAIAVASLAFFATIAKADVTAEGDVSPSTDPALPLMVGTAASGIIVGGSGLFPNDPPIGRLVIDDPGATLPLTSPTGSIGATADSEGDATVSGFGSEWRVTDL